MSELLNAALERKLLKREQEGIKRSLFLKGAGIDFFSNDYLGIARRERPQHRETHASGATGSRLLSGNTHTAMDLEQYLARWHDAAATLLFNSGYDANLGLICALADRHTTILYDEYVHASLIDGIRLSQKKQAFRFRHNDLADLELKLRQYGGKGPVLLVVEAVYSMEGDKAPLTALAEIAAASDAALIVDEAHSTGIFGAQGAGLVQAQGLQHKVFARVHTFGKAMGCHGAIVAGSRLLIDYLVNYARSFIYTTALPQHTIADIRSSYEWLAECEETRQRLSALISFFNRHKEIYNHAHWLDSDTPIQSLILNNNLLTRTLADNLQQAGINAAAVLPPTVPEGRPRIRICLHAFNTEEEIMILFNTIKKWQQAHVSL